MRRNRFGELTDDSPERDFDPIIDVEETFDLDGANEGVYRKTEGLRFGGFESPAWKRSEPGEPLPEPVERREAELSEDETPERASEKPDVSAREMPLLRTGEPTDFQRGEARSVERTFEAGTVFAACEGEDGYRLRALAKDEAATGPRYCTTRTFRAIEERSEGKEGVCYRMALSLAELIELRALERVNESELGGGEETDG